MYNYEEFCFFYSNSLSYVLYLGTFAPTLYVNITCAVLLVIVIHVLPMSFFVFFADIENVLQRMTIIGVLLSFRSLAQEALIHVSLPILYM